MQTDQPKKSDQRNPLRIGLVGCGRVAEFGYLPAFGQATAVKLAGVADVNQSRCKGIRAGRPAHASIRDLISAGGLDALVISTPTRFHLADARCAAEAGLTALVEKPPGLNVGKASALQALNPSPWIAFNRRFEPGIAALKEALPRDASLHLQLELHYRKHSWKSFDMQDDVLLDLGPHLIAPCVSTLREEPPSWEPPGRSEFMSRLFAREVLPYAAIQIRIGSTNLCERRVTFRSGGHSFNIANKAVLSGSFVSGVQD